MSRADGAKVIDNGIYEGRETAVLIGRIWL